jgi:hypothetical protein
MSLVPVFMPLPSLFWRFISTVQPPLYFIIRAFLWRYHSKWFKSIIGSREIVLIWRRTMSNVRYFAHRFATKLFCAPCCNEVLVSTLGLDQTWLGHVHWCYVELRILSDLSSRITYHTYGYVELRILRWCKHKTAKHFGAAWLVRTGLYEVRFIVTYHTDGYVELRILRWCNTKQLNISELCMTWTDGPVRGRMYCHVLYVHTYHTYIRTGF